MAGKNSPEPFLVLARDFDAPRELVHKAWTEPGHFVHGRGPDVPEEMPMTVTFEDLGGRTRLKVAQTMPVSVANANQAQAGWGQSFDKLDDYLGRT